MNIAEKFQPQHMSSADRNERLYNGLLSLGLVATPVIQGGEITGVHVSADLPKLHTSSITSISEPMQGS
ncbi:hypothetical protein Cva_00853 [Caedimonas varicaedens]|uniref:Uncharacterized protein n=1 Tax=Caedimonas varicaedens TaxID=1629334 RepID=A0A0K8MCC7_9PROT|nr:hypothetical protein Cva_00853 [Caedimonas varicaedens]